jgi:preprotein translocase subunit SecG
MMKHRLLLYIGTAGVIIGLVLLTDRGSAGWGTIIFQVGSIALTAGLAAWAILHDLRR